MKCCRGHFLAYFFCDALAHPIYYTLSTRFSSDLLALPDFAAYKKLGAPPGNPRSPIQLLPEQGVPRYQGKRKVTALPFPDWASWAISWIASLLS
jgi:hypothetical protein